MTNIAIEELVIPRSIDDADAADFSTSIEILNRVEAESYGHEEMNLRPGEVLQWWQDPANPRVMFGVRVDGVLVGRAMMARLVSDPDTCWVSVGVLSDYRNRGIGTALAERLERFARDEGRTKMLTYVISKPVVGGERLDAPTGFGSVPADNTEVRFLLKRGFQLEQVGRASRLALPVEVSIEPVDGYRVHHWIDTTPPEWLEQMANLFTRMSTDAPSAGLESPEDVYTVERVIEQDAAAAANPRSLLVAAVEHIATGQLAGYTTLSTPPELDRPVSQYDTLVLREHRGHGLGRLLKLANIDHLQRLRPGHPSILTTNAEENRFMLDVNEAVGFVPAGLQGGWRKDL